MKRFVIVQHRANEYSNRLLSDMSVYAYSIEKGTRVINISFFEQTPMLRSVYAFCAWTVDKFTRNTSNMWAVGGPKVLSGTEAVPAALELRKTLYFFGWLFRNPEGLIKYRDRILAAFAPKKSVLRKVDAIMTSLPKERVRIGVQLRQKPFKGFEDGEFLVSPERVRHIIDEYLKEKSLSINEVALVVASDSPLSPKVFEGYVSALSYESPEVALHLLSRCSIVVGTNSTLSNVAAWFGNVPHVVTKNTPIDWAYYQGKEAYFENKYADFAQ